MKEIKIRYRIRSKNFPNIIDTDIVILEQIEKGYISDIYKGCEILSRDLFTGSRDKNGKEIYEKDIILLRGAGDLRVLNEVIYDVKYAQYRLNPIRVGECVKNAWDLDRPCEVVSNIYDYTEILK